MKEIKSRVDSPERKRRGGKEGANQTILEKIGLIKGKASSMELASDSESEMILRKRICMTNQSQMIEIAGEPDRDG